MFFSPIRITVWSGFAGWNHMKTNLRAWGAHELQQHIFRFFLFLFFSPWDATDHTLIPVCCLCKSHVAGLISILLLGSGWTRSSLVVYTESDSEDYRVYAVTLCGSEGDTVTKPSEQTGLNQTYCICAPRCLESLTFPLPDTLRMCSAELRALSKPGNCLSNHPMKTQMPARNKLPCCVHLKTVNGLYIWKPSHHVVTSDNPVWRLGNI